MNPVCHIIFLIANIFDDYQILYTSLFSQWFYFRESNFAKIYTSINVYLYLLNENIRKITKL